MKFNFLIPQLYKIITVIILSCSASVFAAGDPIVDDLFLDGPASDIEILVGIDLDAPITIVEVDTLGMLYYNVENYSGQDIWAFAVSNNGYYDMFIDEESRTTWNGIQYDMSTWDSEFADTIGSFSSFFGIDNYAYYFYLDSHSIISELSLPILSGQTSEYEFGLFFALAASDFVALNIQGGVINQSRPINVPEPSSLAIFGLALMGLFGATRKNKR